MKRFITGVAACLLALATGFSVQAQTSFGNAAKFNDGWRFILSDVENAQDPQFDDSRWQAVTLPHDWSVKQLLSPDNASCQGYLPGGIGWYRKHFQGRQVNSELAYIYFEGVYNRSSVYLNGHLLGSRPNGYVSFMYDMTPYLNKNGDNVLAVRVDHSQDADSRWYTGSGIYRNVWLVRAGQTHFALWGVGYQTSKLTNRQATVTVDTEIEGLGNQNAKVVVNIKDAAGKVVGKASAKAVAKQKLDVRVSNPHMWSLEDPYLYKLEVSIEASGKVLDKTVINAGIRSLAFDANRGFALNGRWMKIKGVCLHHDAGVLGAAVPPEVWETRLKVLKNMGVNSIRTSHNPQNPDFYDVCDKIGLLVLDEAYDEWEFPKNKWISGWNRGTPGHQGTFDFFYDWCEQDITSMVKRDRNHVSVYMWSIGNEVDYPNDPYSHPILDGDGSAISQPVSGGYKPDAPSAMRIGEIAERLAGYVRAVDTSRPVTGALAGVVMSNQTTYPQAVDVVGYNYTESRYVTDHEAYPDRILYGSETGHGLSSWRAVQENEHIFGQYIWTGADYLGESNAWPSRGMGTGLIDFANNLKPGGYFRQALWSEVPFTYIGTSVIPAAQVSNQVRGVRPNTSAFDLWNYEDGDNVRVSCYTNSPKARLLLNGKEVGQVKPYEYETGVIYWDIPYQPGELKAQGLDESGTVVESEYSIFTTGRPYSLKAMADKPDLDAEAGAVVQVSIEVVDETGMLVKLADNEITCRVTGPGKLLGLESGNNTDMGIWTDNTQRAYHGRLLAYIQLDGSVGEIKVNLSSPLLKGGTLTIGAHRYTTIDKIQLSDPFILADDATKTYYMTGTGGRLWKSKDLLVWDGPMTVAQPNPRSWMGPNPQIWAAEIHKYNGKYYYFATFTNNAVQIDSYRGNNIPRRACHILVSDTPEGPYTPILGGDETYLPDNQPTLDATLFIDSDGMPYMIFCHEWLQNWNGTVEKIHLKPDFSGTYGGRTTLFRAFDSPWSREKDEKGNDIPNKVTDGPYAFRTQTGKLGMIWTSWRYNDYTQGVAYSQSGTLDGPWVQMPDPITPPNYGHGMIFRTFDGRLLLCCHSHDTSTGRTVRIPAMFLLDDSGDQIKVLSRIL